MKASALPVCQLVTRLLFFRKRQKVEKVAAASAAPGARATSAAAAALGLPAGELVGAGATKQVLSGSLMS